jgi:hypothetical protein
MTEPWQKTTCAIWFGKADGIWTIRDTNEIRGFGRYIKPPADEPIRPSFDTTKMSKEEIVRSFYGALIARDADKAVRYLECSDPLMKLQWRNILRGLLPQCGITEIREVKMEGEGAFVRIGVQKGFPGAGCAKLPDERQAHLVFVQAANGLKINGMRSFLGDSPSDYR